MGITGFALDKIMVERKGLIKPGTELKNHIEITSVKPAKIQFNEESKEALVVDFAFSVDYSSAGKLEFSGHVMFYDSSEIVKEALDFWKKNEKIPTSIGAPIYNFLLIKCNVKALQLEEDVGFPLHIIMPTVQPKK